MCTWRLEVLMEWMTEASCSGFQAGVVSKCLGIVQLCSARTSKGQLRLFEQWPSINRGSDSWRGPDLWGWHPSECKGPQCQLHPGNERCVTISTLPVQGQCLHSDYGFCQTRVQPNQSRAAFTCLGSVRPALSAGFDPKTCKTPPDKITESQSSDVKD